MTHIEILDSEISPSLKSDCELNSPIDIDEFSYNDFFCKYLIPNKPCIIQSNATKNWFCRNNWVKNEAPNFQLLQELFGKFNKKKINKLINKNKIKK